MVKVDRRIRWHYTTTLLRLCIGAWLTRYRNCKFHNGCRTISRRADGISRYSVPPSAGPLLPLNMPKNTAYTYLSTKFSTVASKITRAWHFRVKTVAGFHRSDIRPFWIRPELRKRGANQSDVIKNGLLPYEINPEQSDWIKKTKPISKTFRPAGSASCKVYMQYDSLNCQSLLIDTE